MLGKVISVDQLVSLTSGFVPIHRGKPTTKRYVGATVFVDDFSDFTYAHLMTEMIVQSTIDAKAGFECVLQSHNITVQHYHTDNSLFDTVLFKGSITKAD